MSLRYPRFGVCDPARFEAGQVFLPKEAPWLSAFLHVAVDLIVVPRIRRVTAGPSI